MRDFLDDVRGTEWTQKSDEDLIAAKQRHILFSRHVVGTVTKDLHDNVSGGKHRSAIGDDLYVCALVGVLGIGIAGLDSSAGLDVDFETGLDQRREDCRHEGNSPLARIIFFRHTDDHEALPVWRFSKSRWSRFGAAWLASILHFHGTK